MNLLTHTNKTIIRNVECFIVIKWVKKNIIKFGIDTRDIKIKLLCYPRILGYVFNPLSIFFVYDKSSNLILK